MFSSTGNLSLLLSIFFIVLSLSGIFVIYLIIKNKSIENENIDKIIDLGKWFIVSVGITLSASIVNDGFRERGQDIKEMEVFDKYINTILEADSLNKRKLLCEYFAAVSPEGSIKTSWKNYEKIVDDHISELETDEKTIIDIAEKVKKDEASDFEIEIKNRLEKKVIVLNQSLIPKQHQDIQEWAIIAGGDLTLEAASDEVKKIEKLDYPVSIYKKRNSYRTVVGPFLDKTSMSVALVEIKEKVRKGSYAVNLKSWCKTYEIKDGFTDCK